MRWSTVVLCACLSLLAGCGDRNKDITSRLSNPSSAHTLKTGAPTLSAASGGKKSMDTKTEAPAEATIEKSDEEWRKELTPEQYNILRKKGTEMAFTGKFWNHFEAGVYVCAACGAELFPSATKFESHCGWPSFWESIDQTKIRYQHDNSHNMQRTEVLCARCGGHLGHLFEDGPKPTGKRYCINSESLRFIPNTKP